jgi:hypothetical protein
LVPGVEADVGWANWDAKSKTYPDPSGAYYMQSRIEVIATALLRAGYATGSNLFYVTGGYPPAQHPLESTALWPRFRSRLNSNNSGTR